MNRNLVDREQLGVDRDLLYGPKKERSCTDIFCCIAFAGFWLFTLLVVITSGKSGDLSKIARPYDYDGNACGYITNGTDLTEFKYLFIDTTTSATSNLDFLQKSVCVKSCPTSDNLTVSCSPTFFVSDCSTLNTYDSTVVLNRFCMPSDQTLLQKISSLFSGFNLESITESIYANRWIIFVSIGLAFGLSYVFTVVLQYCTWLLVLVSIIGIYVIGIAGGIMCWNKYKNIQSQAVPSSSSGGENNDSSANFYKWMAIALWICVILFTLAIIFAFSEIKLAIAVIQSAADFVSDHKAVVFIPIILILVMGIFVLYWSYGLAAIYSTGELYHDPKFPWGKIRGNDGLDFKVFSHVFSLVWNLSFLLAISEFVISCSASLWYFTRSESDSSSPISLSLGWALRYHIGSLAFASLLLALVFVLRVIAQYLNDSLKKQSNKDKGTELAVKCFSCVIAVLEKFLKFFNKHSYIQMALTSENYCTASRNAMKIVANNFLRFGILHGLGEIVMNMVVVFIALIGTYFSYLLLQKHSPEAKDMQGAAPSLLIVLFVQAAIGKLFMHIWEVSGDSIMHCHCIDEELGGGRAANAPEKLKSALDNNAASYGYH